MPQLLFSFAAAAEATTPAVVVGTESAAAATIAAIMTGTAAAVVIVAIVGEMMVVAFLVSEFRMRYVSKNSINSINNSATDEVLQCSDSRKEDNPGTCA